LGILGEATCSASVLAGAFPNGVTRSRYRVDMSRELQPPRSPRLRPSLTVSFEKEYIQMRSREALTHKGRQENALNILDEAPCSVSVLAGAFPNGLCRFCTIGCMIGSRPGATSTGPVRRAVSAWKQDKRPRVRGGSSRPKGSAGQWPTEASWTKHHPTGGPRRQKQPFLDTLSRKRGIPPVSLGLSRKVPLFLTLSRQGAQ
jgi:hypothetical protein